mgnify:CR=1 FL=1
MRELIPQRRIPEVIEGRESQDRSFGPRSLEIPLGRFLRAIRPFVTREETQRRKTSLPGPIGIPERQQEVLAVARRPLLLVLIPIHHQLGIELTQLDPLNRLGRPTALRTVEEKGDRPGGANQENQAQSQPQPISHSTRCEAAGSASSARPERCPRRCRPDEASPAPAAGRSAAHAPHHRRSCRRSRCDARRSRSPGW